jgi:hypothetical protein
MSVVLLPLRALRSDINGPGYRKASMKPRKRQPPTSPVNRPSRTPRCRWDTLGLIAAALVGFCGLIQFGYFVAKNDAKHQGVGGEVIIRAEIRAIYASQALADFCKNHDLSAIRGREELMCLLECEGLQKIWYGSTVRLVQANGQSRDSSGVGSLAEPGFRHTLAILQTLSGRPPRTATMDYRSARIVIISRQLENEKPLAALEELLMHPEGMEAKRTPRACGDQ